MKRYALVGVVIGLAAAAATKTVSRSFDDTKLRDDHGQYQILPDAGYAVTCCGAAFYMDGGQGVVEQPCVTVEAGTLGASYAACKAAWLNANGFQ